jgi:hypothetical protein
MSGTKCSFGEKIDFLASTLMQKRQKSLRYLANLCEPEGQVGAALPGGRAGSKLSLENAVMATT